MPGQKKVKFPILSEALNIGIGFIMMNYNKCYFLFLFSNLTKMIGNFQLIKIKILLIYLN